MVNSRTQSACNHRNATAQAEKRVPRYSPDFGILEDGTRPKPSVNELSFLLQKCKKEGDINLTQLLHSYIERNGLESHPTLGNNLVPLLVGFGKLGDAKQVFDRLTYRSETCWNSLIKGYAKCREEQQAIDLYKRMSGSDPVQLSPYTYAALLKACAELNDLEMGSQIQADTTRLCLHPDNVLVGTSVVAMYARCGSLALAQEVFDHLRDRDVVSWTTLITGYVEGDRSEDALHCFEKMQEEGILPDAFTFACSLKACSSTGATEEGQQIHSDVVTKGLERDTYVANTLIDMYATFGLISDAQNVFDKLPSRDTVSWNALIAGYVENGLGNEALNCSVRMTEEGFHKQDATFVCILQASGSTGDGVGGRRVHTEISRRGLEKNVFIGSALVDMYVRFGLLPQAQEVFDRLLVRNVVSWTALLNGYTEHEEWEGALECFDQMQHECVFPVMATFLCAMRACGSLGAIEKGSQIHGQVARQGLEKESVIGNMLVVMYAKCACLAEAQELFDKLLSQDMVSWSTLIAGYGLVGESEKVFFLFDKMVEDGMEPNVVTVGNVLNTCSHSGLVDEAQVYFEAMSKDNGIILTLEHHNCMADLFSRVGRVDKAVVIINEMPLHPGILVWHAVLAACQKWHNVEVGREAFAHAVWLSEEDATTYICMSNIYADAARLEDCQNWD